MDIEKLFKDLGWKPYPKDVEVIASVLCSVRDEALEEAANAIGAGAPLEECGPGDLISLWAAVSKIRDLAHKENHGH